jgi:hypothetical protein
MIKRASFILKSELEHSTMTADVKLQPFDLEPPSLFKHTLTLLQFMLPLMLVVLMLLKSIIHQHGVQSSHISP